MAAPKPRLCHLKKVPDFAGFGFNLFTRAGSSSQFIGKVDPKSPAEVSGLRREDRVVEVNGKNVENSSHSEVVARIKEGGSEVKLLVVDNETDSYYQQRQVPITEALLHDAEPQQAEQAEQVEKPAEVQNAPTETNEQEEKHVEAHVSIVGNVESAPPTSPNPTPKPRLCALKKVPTFTGYGFNLQAKVGYGQVIGKVDPNSPAQTAGLLEGDRVVEVNGENVENQTHAQIVNCIKQNPNEVSMLVVDAATDEYFKERSIPITVALLNGESQPEQRGFVEKIERAEPEYSTVQKTRSSAPKPRLCVIARGPNGYGFNLHTEKGRNGQYIGKVDPDSPAELAGLLEKDKVVEVNGSNVENDSHAQVVTRIKEKSNEVTLLVADLTTEAYYRDRSIPITRDLLQEGVAPPAYENGGVQRNGSLQRDTPAAVQEPVKASIVSPVVVSQPAPTAPSQTDGKSEILAVTPAQVRERLQQNNPRVRVKQSDKSFRDKSAAFDML